MTTPERDEGGNSSPFGAFNPERIARLEERMGANGDDVRELKQAVDDTRESNSGLKRRVNDMELAVVREIGELKTWIAGQFGELRGEKRADKTGRSDTKWMLSTLLALAGTAIAVYAAVHR